MAVDHWKNEAERLAAENRKLRRENGNMFERNHIVRMAGDEALKQRDLLLLELERIKAIIKRAIDKPCLHDGEVSCLSRMLAQELRERSTDNA